MPHPLFLTALAISSPQEKATSLPSEVAPDLRGLEAQLRRHEELEHELVGTGRQVSQSAASPTRAPAGALRPVLSSSGFPTLPQGFHLGLPCLAGHGLRRVLWDGQALQSLGGRDPSLPILYPAPAAGAARGCKHSTEAGAGPPGPCHAAEAAGSGAGLGGPEATRRAAQDPAGAGMPPGPFPQSGEGSFLLGAACVRVLPCVRMD